MSIAKNRPSKLAAITLWLGLPILLIGVALTITIAINSRTPVVSIPTSQPPSPNGYDDFVSATRLIGSIRSPLSLSDGSKPVDAYTVPQLEAFVEDNAKAMAMLRSGLKKNYLTPPMRSFKDNPYTEYAGFRELARIMAGESIYYYRIGNYAEATDSCLDTMELGVTLPRGGNFIALLVGVADEVIGARYLPPVLPKLNADELAKVAARLDRIQSKRISFSQVVLEDGNCNAAQLSKLVQQLQAQPKKSLQDWVDAYTMPSNPFMKSPGAWQHVRYLMKSKTAIVRDIQSYYSRVAQAQQAPYNGKLNTQPYSGPLSDFLVDSNGLLNVRASYCRAQAITTLLQTEVALRRYKADHATYPASLTQLTPKYLKKTPTDPFGQGKPLCYKPLNQGSDFLLYSRGRNLKDDGGKSSPWNGTTQGKDLVAIKQVNLAQQEIHHISRK